MVGTLTFVRHDGAGLHVQPPASTGADLLDVVAQSVATVLSAVQADALLEDAVVSALVGHVLFVFVQQGVDEQVDRSLVSTLHCLLKT